MFRFTLTSWIYFTLNSVGTFQVRDDGGSGTSRPVHLPQQRAPAPGNSPHLHQHTYSRVFITCEERLLPGDTAGLAGAGGVFAMCLLESSVMSAVVQPRAGCLLWLSLSS